MSGGQVAALIFAIILLLPGGCFLVFGIGFVAETHESLSSLGAVMLIIALAILSLAGLLFRVAFRRRTASGGGPMQPPGPPAA